ncbi:hypothetical protein ACEPAG_2227 [Sanghuangporus baumii]
MPSNSTPNYPPTSQSARRTNSETPDASQPVNKQPTPASTMTTAHGSESSQGAMRLRGGCIPCPDGGCCYIIPIPCCF